MRKTISIWGLLAAFLFAAMPSAFAVNDLLVPKGEDSAQLWTNLIKPSMRTRVQYDDNVTSSKPKDEAWMGIFGPAINFKLPYDHSFIGANAQYVGRYYGGRLGNDRADNDAFVDMVLRHDVSDRMSLGDKIYFAYQQQPNVVKPQTPNFQQPITLEDDGNYAQFVNTAGFQYRFNKWLSIDATYDLEIVDFVNDSNKIVPASLNLMQNKIGFDVNYRMWTDTLFGVGYRFTNGDYETVDKDFSSHLVSGVLRHRMAKDVIIYGRVGYESRAPKDKKFIILPFQTAFDGSVNNIPGANVTSENSKHRDNDPYVEMDITYLFTQATQIKVGYKLKLENSDQPAFFDRKVQGVYGAFTHKLTRKTQILLFGYQDKSDYRNNRVVDAVTPINENLFKFGFLMTQQLKPWMFLELGYRYTDNDSQFAFNRDATNGINRAGTFGSGGANSDYTRNRVFSGVYLTF